MVAVPRFAIAPPMLAAELPVSVESEMLRVPELRTPAPLVLVAPSEMVRPLRVAVTLLATEKTPTVLPPLTVTRDAPGPSMYLRPGRFRERQRTAQGDGLSR